ncbi:MAG: transposase family protein [Proteobacteria bacterium]|nr:transposase family protein [Pseudomonadota bacterium]
MNLTQKKGLVSWAHLRFSIIGGLLANPPQQGELRLELKRLSLKQYHHPTKEGGITFGFSTIERWYYKALSNSDPVSALRRKVRADAGLNRSMSLVLIEELKKQYHVYPRWSYQLHADNLKALILERPELGAPPSYSTVLRRMQEHGWLKQLSGPTNKTPGQIKAKDRLDKKEVRGFESPFVHALWHLDFHSGRRVIDLEGRWHTPKALCVLDDHSRLCCHIQWYLDETAEALIHGFSQALHKRGLPRSLMTDNGSAMLSAEFQNGLLSLSIKHDKTLPYSPYQNGKQESFWGQLEGRLLAMLSKVEPLSLEFLNKATQAWVEQEYNRKVHEEIRQTPLERMLKGTDVSRPSLDSEALHFSFTAPLTRTQRRSDGTLQIKGVRFEVPSRFRHIKRLDIAYKPFDLSMAYLIDSRTKQLVGRIYPLDKTKHADRGRRGLSPTLSSSNGDDPNSLKVEPIPPLLRKLLSDYAATGLPPAYLPKEEVGDVHSSDKFDGEHLF